uniref:Serine/threonine-protein kinase PLK n=1 Tax=Lotharella globosa TaxID=91324 RepID=A0A7S4DIL4_9EUKA
MPRHPVIVADVIEDHTFKKQGKTSHVKRYKKGRLLGKGGFAHCYKITSYDSHRIYACKIIAKASLTKPSARSKLWNEIRLHRDLSHKHIVRFERFFEDDMNVYIVLELCHNQSLMEMVRRRRRLTDPEVKCYMWQLLLCLKYLHGLKIIHRDLKLSNLFLDKDMNLKLGDFGLTTKLANADERKRTICGTPNYIAPEILDARKGHSFEVDIWAIGVIMYTMLVGRPPFETSSIKATYKRIRSSAYKFPENVAISKDARDLIAVILRTNPEKRPTLDGIARHRFFSKEPFPATLPTTSLKVPTDLSELPVSSLITVPGGSPTDATSKSYRPVLGDRTNYTANAHPAPKSHPPLPPRGAMATRSTTRNQIPRARSSGMPQPSSMAKERGVPRATSAQQGGWKRHEENPVEEERDLRDLNDNLRRTILNKASPKPPPPSRPHPGFHEGIVDDTGNCVRAGTTSKVQAGAEYAWDVVWVTRWADYTSKYGMGYALSDGTYGVCFNDQTKIAYHTNEHKFFNYVERRSSQDNSSRMSSHSTENYPAKITKKVLLLGHFKDYLSRSSSSTKSKPPYIGQSPHPNPSYANPTQGESNPVMVKKWMKAEHAMVFRLSNQTVQLVFHDQTEILLSSEHQSVCYSDSNRVRRFYPIGEGQRL